MSYTDMQALRVAIASAVTAEGGQIKALAGAAVFYMVRTSWTDKPWSRKVATKYAKAEGEKSGLSPAFWGNYIPKVADWCDMMLASHGEDAALHLVRDADSAALARDAMVAFMAANNVTKPYHVTKARDAAKAETTPEAAEVQVKNAAVPAPAPVSPVAAMADAIATFNEADLLAVIKAANARLLTLRETVAKADDKAANDAKGAAARKRAA